MGRVDGKQPPPKERYNNTRISKREGAGPNMCLSLGFENLLSMDIQPPSKETEVCTKTRSQEEEGKSSDETTKDIYIYILNHFRAGEANDDVAVAVLCRLRRKALAGA